MRATLRSVLWQAAVSNALPYGLNAHLGNTAAEGIDIDEDDDEAIVFVEETE